MEKISQKPELQLIPWDQAKLLAETFNKDQVIILAWNREQCSNTVTTYGKTVHDSDQAADGGNKLKQVLGWPDKDCHAKSVRVEAMLNALEAAKLELISNNAQKSTAFSLIDNLLRIEGGADHDL